MSRVPPTTPAPLPTETELRAIATARLEDALVLLAGGRWDGAAYMCGYVVEMLLKARICSRLGWTEYPSATLRGKFVDALRTHNLDELLFWSGREPHIQ